MKKLALLTLPLLLAACGTITAGSGNNVSVSASTSTVTLGSDGTSDTKTTYTFTNPAGAKATSITSATVLWGTGSGQSATVAIPAVNLPAGLTCAAAAANPSAACDYNDNATTLADRSISAAISDSTLFASVYAANPSAKNLPVSVTFNGASNAVNFSLTVTSTGTGTAPTEPLPSPVLNVVGTGPFSGNMSVNVSGNFDASSEVDRIVLQVTDSQGVVDNSTYTTTQARATFSIDTTKFANGALQLQVIAYTKTGLRGSSTVQTVRVQNLTSPDLSVAAPADGAGVTTPTLPVRVTLTKRSADYVVDPQSLQVDVIDYRGVVVLQRTLNTADPATCVGSADSLTCNTQFDMAGLPADTYTIRVRSTVRVDPAGANVTRSLETTSRFTSNTTSVLPPAATIRFPAITDNRAPGRIDSESGVLVSVSDNGGVSVVEARLVGPFDATKALSLNGTSQCLESQPVAGRGPVDVLLLNLGYNPSLAYADVALPNFDIDGSAYVPDNNPNERYDLRVTTVDTEGNRNIQCIPVTINRDQTRAERSSYTTTATPFPSDPITTPGKLNYTSGQWTLSGVTNRSRVAALVYKDGEQIGMSFNANVTSGSISVSQTFANPGTYQINWLVEDMTTGIVTSVAGPYINVVRNEE